MGFSYGLLRVLSVLAALVMLVDVVIGVVVILSTSIPHGFHNDFILKVINCLSQINVIPHNTTHTHHCRCT